MIALIVFLGREYKRTCFQVLTMPTKSQSTRISLPKGWQGCVKSAVLHVIALAHYAIVSVRARTADSVNARVRIAAQNDRLHEECALLRE